MTLRILNLCRSMKEDFQNGVGHSADLDVIKNGVERTRTKPEGAWDQVAEQMMVDLSESGHLVFRGSSAFN